MRCLLLVLALAACGGDDGGSSGGDAGSDSGGGGSFDECTGACMTTAVTATFAMPAGPVTKTLTEAYYGITASTGKVYLEVIGGGTGQCPTMASPTQDYDLILASVAIPSDTTPQSPTSALFDYQGDLLPNGDLHAFGTTTTLTPTNAYLVTYESGFVAFDVTVAFDGAPGAGDDGTMTGHLYAKHCASFDN